MYNEYNDFELIDLINENNEEANNIIFKKYEPLIVSLAKEMMKHVHNSGIDLNDMIQEGMIGLNNAIQTFKDVKETLFYTYARTCIKRKMIDLIVASNRQKYQALNNSISFDRDDETDLSYLIKDELSNPEDLLIKEESKTEIMDYAIRELTPIEYQIFELRVNGFNYKEIAEILDINTKKIDNALRRIKNKLKQFS